mmetsp:Transcript_35363/g.97602  ORF Transcript_35363/g.97602 Transcript_35363/m.97602 type:complete len:220 (+) Transcript_35363:302-961(+)
MPAGCAAGGVAAGFGAAEAGNGGSLASSAARRFLMASWCKAPPSSRSQASSPSGVVPGTHPALSMTSIAPAHSPTFLANATLLILILRNLPSTGSLTTFSVIFSSVESAARWSSTPLLDATSARAASKSSFGGSEVDADSAAAGGAAGAATLGAPPPTLPKGLKLVPPALVSARMLRSIPSIMTRSCCPCGVDSASLATLTMLSGMPFPLSKNFATSLA